MIQGLALAWASLCALFFGFPLLYYLYMRRIASNPWNLNIDPNYHPLITILVPTYNEGRTIRYKLENLLGLKYDKNFIQIILIDSASTDGTLGEVLKFIKCHPELNIMCIIEEEEKRSGKSRALNLGLRHSTGEVIVVSDADCFLPYDTLNKALPYLADPNIGAICGQPKMLNSNDTWITKTDELYENKIIQIRLGESKLHSSATFEGGFSAYKKSVLDKFDDETGSDDSGTAFNIVQKKARAITIPEVRFFTYFPEDWFGKITIKTRRAKQLVRIWLRCLKLFFRRQLLLPKRIALPEIYLFLFSPSICLLLMALTVVLLFRYSIFLPIFILLFLIPKSRIYLIEIIQDNFITLLASIDLITKKKSVVWRKAEKTRTLLDVDVLKKKNLILNDENLAFL